MSFQSNCDANKSLQSNNDTTMNFSSNQDGNTSSLKLLQQYYSDSDSEDEQESKVRQELKDNLPKKSSGAVLKSSQRSDEIEFFKLNSAATARILPSTSDLTVGHIEESIKINEMVLKNNIINACQHGPNNTVQPVAKLSEDNNCNANNDNIIMDFDTQRCNDSDSSDSDTSEDESEDSSSDSDSDLLSEWENHKGADDESDGEKEIKLIPSSKKQLLKVKGELSLEDLPPIEDLAISVPEQECELIGTLYDIVDQLVIVQSLPNKPSLDLDTVLFLDTGSKVLGQVFDVFGKVSEPFYCVRFNSEAHIKEKGLNFGMSVYYAPKTSHTNFVFISELMRSKGSDASWTDDVEPPPQFVEFSDDEEERKMKKNHKNNKRNGNTQEEASSNTKKSYKPTEFEERMNRKNIMKTVESDRNNQMQRTRHYSNPFSRRTNNPIRPICDSTSDIRWASGSNTRFGGPSPRFLSRNWGWNMQVPPPSMFNAPPFMRPARFAVPPPDWIPQPFRMRSNVPPPPIAAPSSSWSMFPPSSGPPGT